jgi:DNA-3-methyladenine glycosylase I
MTQRCAWANGSPLMVEYHDAEWGLPDHDDRTLFELLILEGAQAGLSWSTILNKREGYRRAFDGFDVRTVAGYDEAKVAELLANPGIVRNRQKVLAAILNARCVLDIQGRFGSFDAFIWRFVHGRPIQNRWVALQQIPAHTDESDAMSKELQRLGFKFAGSTICYAFMQATGMVNDHTVDCFRWQEVAALSGEGSA